jgi:hypothetical protein
MNNATEVYWDLSQLLNVLDINRTTTSTTTTFFINNQKQQQKHFHLNSNINNNINNNNNIIVNAINNLSVFDELQFFTNQLDDENSPYNVSCCLPTTTTTRTITSTEEPNFIKYFEALPNDRIGLLIFLMLFSFATVFGNSLVILAVIRERYLHTATNYFVTR